MSSGRKVAYAGADLIEREALPGTGIGCVDAQLVAATRLTADAAL